MYAPDEWKGPELEDCIFNWLKIHGSNSMLPFFLIAGIWEVRNAGIFENTPPDVHNTVYSILYHWNEHPERKGTIKIQRVTHPIMEEGAIYGFFDGASQRGICGGGIMIHCSNSHNFLLHVELGDDDGLKAELLALRCLLWFARKKGIKNLSIYGDSQLVVS